MRRNSSLRAFLVTLAFALGLCGSVPAWAYHRASVEVDIGLFYKDLAPHGSWVDVREHGRAWVPRVHHGWRPYAVGHWVWTDDYGWLWLSDEDFGWAVFHYGRWYRDPTYDWVWVPGYEWGPGWVAWRSGGGYVGWAPLPPRVAWSARVGFRLGSAEIDALIEPRDYTFCEERIFVEPGVHRHLFPADRNRDLIRVTRNVTDYRVVESRVVDRSLDVDRVERSIGRRVPRHRVVEVDSVGAARRGRVKGGAVTVFQPRVLPRADAVPPRGTRAPTPEVRERDQRRQAREGERRLTREREQQERMHQDLERRQVSDRAQQAQENRRLQKQRQAEEREMERRQLRENRQRERARQDLERRQGRERQAMEKQHRREIRKPQGEADLDQRLAREHREMTERQQRERQQQEAARTQARRERQEAAAAQRRGAENQGDHRAKTPDKKREAREKPKDRPKDKDRPQK